MATFNDIFGVVLAICCGVMILTVFFKIIGYFNRFTLGDEIVKVKGFVKQDKLINVHLKDGKSVLMVRFVGFTDYKNERSRIPFQLSNLLVLENDKGARILISPDSVQMIEEVGGIAETAS